MITETVYTIDITTVITPKELKVRQKENHMQTHLLQRTASRKIQKAILT